MKSSIKGFFVILAIVMSFVLVQGVYARDTETLKTFTGTVVTSVDETTRSITLEGDMNNDGVTDSITIFGMGPSWYWDDVVVIPYPRENDNLEIEAFYCDFLGDYVGISVCYLEGDNGCIDLRDDGTLKPLWNPKAKTTDLSDTATEATGDGIPNDPNDWDYDWNNDNNYNHYEDYNGQPGPHKKDF